MYNYIQFHSEKESVWIIENNTISPKNDRQICYSFGELTAHIHVHTVTRCIQPSSYCFYISVYSALYFSAFICYHFTVIYIYINYL